MTKLHFENAPLNEIVFGVNFSGRGFTPMHYGLFWPQVKDRYPRSSIQTPLMNAKQANSTLGALELLPRVWFESEDGHSLLQLQRDRLYFNWRQLDLTDTYPHFEPLFSSFSQTWSDFFGWSRGCEIPFDASPVGFEMTYINHIDERFGWHGPQDTGKFLSFFEGSLLGDKGICVAGESRLNFELGNGLGNLTALARAGVTNRNGKAVPVLVFELTLKGRGENPMAWYNSAHESILDAFLKLTVPEGREVWKSGKGN